MTPLKYTLCFLTRGDEVLMLHRRNPPNQNRWNGVGGKIHPGERPLAACLREVEEETGYLLADARFAGLLTWSGFEVSDGGLYLFVAEAPPGEPRATLEGELQWKPRDWVFSAPEVVSNIPRFGPLILDGAPPQVYHFDYAAGEIVNYRIGPMPEAVSIV